jgi:hypothetical protein
MQRLAWPAGDDVARHDRVPPGSCSHLRRTADLPKDLGLRDNAGHASVVVTHDDEIGVGFGHKVGRFPDGAPAPIVARRSRALGSVCSTNIPSLSLLEYFCCACYARSGGRLESANLNIARAAAGRRGAFLASPAEMAADNATVGKGPCPCRLPINSLQSDRYTVSIELMIFVIATLAGAQVSEIMHELDRRDPLDHLEA